MAETPQINISVNLGNATQEIDRFGQALSRVSEKARGIYATMRELSERYQQQGFLGTADQRSLERGMQSWHRAGELLDLQRRGALSRVRELAARSTGADDPALRAAERAMARLDAQRLGRGMLQRDFPIGMLAGQVPGQPAGVTYAGRFTPWQPGMRSPLLSGTTPTYAGGFTPWEPGMRSPLLSGTTPTYAGGFTPWEPGMRSPLLSGTQPTYAGHFTPWQPGMQPPQQQAEQQAQERRDRLRGYAASAGISLLSQGGPFGRIAGGAATGFAVAGPAGAAIGAGVALLGEGLAKASDAAQAWQQRARGVLAVGQLLDQNFSGITTSIVRLNKEFDVLTSESVQAMDAMSRVTGRRDPEALHRAVGFGVAYGMAPAQAAGLAGTMAMLGAPSLHPLRAVAAGARNAFGTGGLPMRMDVLQEEAMRIAGIGGTAAVPMDPEYYGRIAGFVGGMGTRYQEPGAAAGFAERLARGVSTAPDPATLMLRHRAIDQWVADLRAQGRSTEVTIGRGPNAELVDLTSYEGRRIAMEQAWQSPELMDQYRRISEREFGFDPELRAIGFEKIVGGNQLGPTEARRARRRAEQGGGFVQSLTAPGRATPATEAALEAEREGRRREAIEALPGRVEAAWQAMMERLGEIFSPKFLEGQLKLIEVEGKLEQTLREQFASLSAAVNTHFPSMIEALQRFDQAMQQIVQQFLGVGPLAKPGSPGYQWSGPEDPTLYGAPGDLGWLKRLLQEYQWSGPSDPGLYTPRAPTSPTKPTAVK
jgi:hypothetical protein